jgi:hypothetical protein
LQGDLGKKKLIKKKNKLPYSYFQFLIQIWCVFGLQDDPKKEKKIKLPFSNFKFKFLIQIWCVVFGLQDDLRN